MRATKKIIMTTPEGQEEEFNSIVDTAIFLKFFEVSDKSLENIANRVLCRAKGHTQKDFNGFNFRYKR